MERKNVWLHAIPIKYGAIVLYKEITLQHEDLMDGYMQFRLGTELLCYTTEEQICKHKTTRRQLRECNNKV